MDRISSTSESAAAFIIRQINASSSPIAIARINKHHHHHHHPSQPVRAFASQKQERQPQQRKHTGFASSQMLVKDHRATDLNVNVNVAELLHGATSVATLAHLLKRCGEAKALSDGKLVHAHIKRYICSENIFLGNWLVKMYGDCGSMADARAVFDSLPDLNVYSWNILIKGYAKNRRGTEALESLRRMQLSGIKPNHITLVSALDACKSKAALENGRQIHAAVVAGGYGGQSVVGNALINMYAKCGSLDNARNVFMGMPRRDVISWNAVISACTLNGHSEEALDFFDRMQGEGFKPDEFSFVGALDACASLAALEKGIEVHAATVESGYEEHMIVGTSLVNMYGKCGKLNDARSVFSRMPKRNKISWCAMMSACNQNVCPKEALDLFAEMQQNRIEPDRVAFICALDACAILADLEQGRKIHAAIIREGYEDYVVIGNALVNMYGKCRSLEDARNMFHRMSYRDVISWNAIIAACSQNVQSKLALDLYDQMQREGFKPEAVTFVCALEACASLAALEKGQKIHGAIVHSGCEGEVIVGTALINMYGKCGLLEDARNVFNRMARQDVVSWSAMIAACTLNDDAKEALDLFKQMQCNGFKPDQFTFACALDACASLAALEKGQEIHAALIKARYEGQVVVATALVNMYGKCGSLEDARNVFDHMPHRNLVCWNAMIAACAHNGHGIKAIELLKQMQHCGFKPDQATFLSILSACSHSGSVDEAKHFFKSMTEDHGLTQNVEHYLCLIDILGRAGHLNDAEDFINGMPYEKETSVWLSLLGHCQIHGDVERGIRAARHALNSDPRNATAYVLLSNIYAETGIWEA